jgi:Fungal specific transcription factor domain
MGLYRNYLLLKSKDTYWTCILPTFTHFSPSSISKFSSIHTRLSMHLFFCRGTEFLMLTFFNRTRADSPPTSEPDTPNTSPFNRRRGRVPILLLLTMYAIASRYDDSEAPANLDPSIMWEAGDQYLDSAKVILDRSYTSSRPSTCQSLLLMGYREIGIGAMAQAWTYIGMAIRMAQDLGMHRIADGWERVGLGGRLFNDSELNERKRIWSGCVIMDKYVSTYIGLSFISSAFRSQELTHLFI